MQFDIISLFPGMFDGPFSTSMLKKAQDKNLVEINFHQLHDFGFDERGTVDDSPYGGGKGMILKVDVVDKAITEVRSQKSEARSKVILLSPKGKRLTQDKVVELASNFDHLILLCGHYEEFDERIRQNLVDEDISIGDFVLTGGEIPAMALVDSVSRLIPGVLAAGSATDESFMQKDESGDFLLEYPQYTRPEIYKDWPVPEVLLSGNHAEIEKWRQNERKKAS
ncbi:MAG: tRNA (guanosine(37)-N1)-methyltransferase TrmD [Candidatus Berkelbacteria bacterium]|nr:tRNA (guanosine(37)-N1)-methyltransferase TrmD [Candidatus Berkelbacteria bacterium]